MMIFSENDDFHENAGFDEIHQKYLVNHCLEQHFEHFAKTCDFYDFAYFT